MTNISYLRFLAILIATLPTTLMAQTERTVVLEHFSNTNCSFCGSRNPGLFANIENNAPEVVHISFHPSRPYSDCKLNNHNKVENDDRTKFYGLFGGTPQISIQGEPRQGANFNDAKLFEGEQGMMSSFEVKVEQAKTEEKIDVSIVITAAEDNTVGNLNVLAYIVEDTVFYKGRNSEDEHFNVFRKSMGGINGESKALPSTKGESIEINYSSAHHQDWDLNRVYAIVLLQDPMSKEIHQAGVAPNESLPTSITPIKTNSFKIYPTVVDRVLVIEGNTDAIDFELINLQGQVVMQGPVVQQQIPMTSVESGVYFLKLNEEVYRVLKQ